MNLAGREDGMDGEKPAALEMALTAAEHTRKVTNGPHMRRKQTRLLAVVSVAKDVLSTRGGRVGESTQWDREQHLEGEQV